MVMLSSTSHHDSPRRSEGLKGLGKALRPSQHTHSASGMCRLNSQRQSSCDSTAAASTGPVT